MPLTPTNYETEFVVSLIMFVCLAFYAAYLRNKVIKLQAFKDYTHQRLDAMNIPVDPPSPHKERGCRIGGRLDYVEQLTKVQVWR